MGNLVGGDWNMTFIFPYVGNVIIPIDVHIFQRGGYTTNQMLLPRALYHDSFSGLAMSMHLPIGKLKNMQAEQNIRMAK